MDASFGKIVKTTLSYIRKDGQYLMLYRNKKENDINEGKWIGVGGKFEKGESADACMKREVFEETGLTVTDFHYYGVIRFYEEGGETILMYLYTVDDFEGEAKTECDEGILKWVPEEELLSLPTWEGDKEFLVPMLEGKESINMSLYYKGDKLVKVIKQNNKG